MADVDDRKALIQRLFGAANKHADEGRLDGYLESLRLMDTPRMLRVVDKILAGIAELTDPEDYKPPTAGAIWKVARAMRRLPDPRPLELTPPPAAMDGWDQNANLLLLAYVTRGLVPKVIGMRGVPMPDAGRYAPDSPYSEKLHHVVVGPQTIERTAILVKFKNAWARDMREDHEEGGTLDGKKHWADCMSLAEAELDRYIASLQVAA